MRGASIALRALLLVGVVLVSGVIGHVSGSETGPFGIERRPSKDEIRRLEGVAVMSIANATWLLGSADQVRRTTQTALARVPESDGRDRARLHLRLALLVDSIDGQGALLHEACSEDPDICNDLVGAASREASGRSVAPGNRLPISLVEGHPPLDPR